MRRATLLLLSSLIAFSASGCDFLFEPESASSSAVVTGGRILDDHVYYKIEDDHAVVVGFYPWKDIEVKSVLTYKGVDYPVTAVGEKEISDDPSDFPSRNEITETLVIPESVVEIRALGIGNMKSLKSLILPNGLRKLEQGALYLSVIEHLSLPSFGEGADLLYDLSPDPHGFISLSNYVNVWSEDHLDKSMSIGRALLDPKLDFYSEMTIHDHDHFVWPKKVTITAGEYIYPLCFFYSGAVEVHFPSTLKGCYPYAFHNCWTKFDAYFDGIDQYASLSTGEEAAIGYYAKSLFVQGEKVTNVVLSEGVESIGDYAFYNFDDIEEIVLPSSLKHVGQSAFSSYGTARVNYSKQGFYFGNESNPYVYLAYTSDNIETFAFHEDCRVLAENAFAKCKSTLRKATTNDSVTEIPARAFYGYTSLQEFAFAGESHVKVIGNEAFSESGLTSFSFGASIQFIGQQAFYNCKALEFLSWPESVDELIIGMEAFFGADLSLVEIPEGTVEVGPDVFDVNFNRLTNIVLPTTLRHYPKIDQPDYLDLRTEFDGTLRWHIDSGSMFYAECEGELPFVNPHVYVSGGQEEYVDMFECVDQYLNDHGYGQLQIQYHEHIAYSRGGVFEPVEAGYAYLGRLDLGDGYEPFGIVPETLYGKPVSEICLSYSAGVSFLQLSSAVTTLRLTSDSPRRFVANESLAYIDGLGDTSDTFYLYTYATEESFKVGSVPSNVHVYYYSETKNADGCHWRWYNQNPSVWQESSY